MKRSIQNHFPGLMDFLHDEFHDHEDDKWIALFREQNKVHDSELLDHEHEKTNDQ